VREYTLPTGPFNLVSHLPEFFGRPELAVRIHAGYGSAQHPANVAFSKLRAHTADCVNVLMYVEAPASEADNQRPALARALKDAGCCAAGRQMAGAPGKKVGAVWHIFQPGDTDKIVRFLAETSNGSSWRQDGSKAGSSSMDAAAAYSSSSVYLDRAQRARLLAEHGVQCCTVLQCLGDAVFIPALSLHQMKNLQSCISASKEFLSPESIELCYSAARQQRCSSAAAALHTDSHTGAHADTLSSQPDEQLQVENVIFHSIKAAIAVLQEAEET
jgi:lysine-specific demethylase 3